jgi:CubicO group peptidase (beta-lactamase class C family)
MKSKKTIRTVFMAILVLTCTVVSAQMSTKQIDELVETALDKFGVAGASVGVVKDGEIMFVKGYGVKSIKSKDPVDENTPFAIASLSKAFTTAALSILVEEGKLGWNDKVTQHIPEFKMYNSYVTENFNIKDLLTHRSGLGLGVGDLMGFPDGGNFTIDDVLQSFQYFEPQSAFRTQFDYDNLLYWVAGEVIKRASGMEWEDFVDQKILNPLQMDHSYPSLSKIEDLNSIAIPHIREDNNIRAIQHFKESVNGAAGGIQSSASDMCKWMLVQLNAGKYGANLEQQLFSKKSQHEMWKINTVVDAGKDPRYNSHFFGYGLGWFLNDMKGNLSVSHTGGLPGMLSKLWLVPDIDLGIIILTNTSEAGGAFFSAVSKTIVDSYLGLEPINWTDQYVKMLQERQDQGDTVTEKVWETVESNKNVSLTHQDYTGTYKDKWFGSIEIYEQNGNLWFKAERSPKLMGQMFFYKANTFAIKWVDRDLQADAFASFILDEEGKASEIKMKGISPNMDFSYDFHDLKLVRVDH